MDLLHSAFACTLMLSGFLLLLWLSAIDLKLRLLPNELTFALALCGLGFMWVIAPYGGPWYNPLAGALAAGGCLYLIRALANRIYGFETMGLGDVKLMLAGGLWLGLEGAIMALSVGAIAGLLHGLGHAALMRARGHKDVSLRGLTIPAGPGFAAGLLIIAIAQYHALPLFQF